MPTLPTALEAHFRRRLRDELFKITTTHVGGTEDAFVAAFGSELGGAIAHRNTDVVVNELVIPALRAQDAVMIRWILSYALANEDFLLGVSHDYEQVMLDIEIDDLSDDLRDSVNALRGLLPSSGGRD